MSYRIEVSASALSQKQGRRFASEAQRAGFAIKIIHNGLSLAVLGLTCKQATTLRDGLNKHGIHSSIGIS